MIVAAAQGKFARVFKALAVTFALLPPFLDRTSGLQNYLKGISTSKFILSNRGTLIKNHFDRSFPAFKCVVRARARSKSSLLCGAATVSNGCRDHPPLSLSLSLSPSPLFVGRATLFKGGGLRERGRGRLTFGVGGGGVGWRRKIVRSK